jgi:hypothetical protein
MADEPPKKPDRFANWRKAAQKGQVSGVGDTDDILKKAVALNPSIKGDKSTQEFFQEVGAARKAGESAKVASADTSETRPRIALVSDPKALPKTDLNDLTQVISSTQTWVEEEKKRIADARARAKSDAAALERALLLRTWESRDRLLQLLRQVDPNLLSPKSQALLETHAAFLKRIGFSREMIQTPPPRPK